MRADFLGAPIDVLTMQETVALVDEAIASRSQVQHVALNVAKFVNMQRDENLRNDVLSADIVGIDGMGIVFAARLLGITIPERVAGVDLMEQILALCARKGYRPYFLGAQPDILDQAMHNVQRRYPSLTIAGTQHGYYGRDKEEAVAEAIRAAKADCLFVGMPTPAKEKFMAKYRHGLGVPYIMGVGGGIDVLAHFVKRAPLWMQNCGLEWLYRTLQEPRRMLKRYVTTNAAFVSIVARAYYGRHAMLKGAKVP